MRFRVRIVLSIALAGAFLAGCASPSTSSGAASTPAELIAAHCNVCHDSVRIRGARHDAAGWADTVARMRGKGARVTDAEAQKIVDFLAGGGASGL
jgi:glutamate-1-semialdehyde aminotransferase